MQVKNDKERSILSLIDIPSLVQPVVTEESKESPEAGGGSSQFWEEKDRFEQGLDFRALQIGYWN